MKTRTKALLALSLPFVASASFAGSASTQAPQKVNTFYAQAGLGISSLQKIEDNEFDRKKNAAYDLRAGVLHGISDKVRLGAEAGYLNLGKQNFFLSLGDGLALNGNIKQSAIDLLAVAQVDILPQITAIAKVGGAYVSQQRDILLQEFSPVIISEARMPFEDDKSLRVAGGLGLHYNLNEKVALTGEWRYIDGKKDTSETAAIASSNTFLLGAKVNIG